MYWHALDCGFPQAPIRINLEPRLKLKLKLKTKALRHSHNRVDGCVGFFTEKKFSRHLRLNHPV
jgi:hypothetical protein